MSKSYPLDHPSGNGVRPRIEASTSDGRIATHYEDSPPRVLRRAACVFKKTDSTASYYPAEVPSVVPPSPPRSWLNSSSMLMFSVSMLSVVPA